MKYAIHILRITARHTIFQLYVNCTLALDLPSHKLVMDHDAFDDFKRRLGAELI